jgi:hypothetical protein
MKWGEIKMYEQMIDDYINDVTAGMGQGQKEDVARELRSHIMDSADAIASERKVAVDEQIISEVLKRMGPAGEVASLYPTGKKFMAAAGMFKAIKVLAGLVLAFVFAAIVLWLSHVDVTGLTGLPIDTMITVAFALVQAIVILLIIAFAFYLYESRIKDNYEERLKKFETELKDTISPLKVWFSIGGTLVFLALFDLFWDRIVFVTSFSGDPNLVQVFAPEFMPFLAIINILCLIGIVVQYFGLRSGNRIFVNSMEAALSAASAVLIYCIIITSPFNAALGSQIKAAITIFLAFVFVMTAFGTAKKLWSTAMLALKKKAV